MKAVVLLVVYLLLIYVDVPAAKKREDEIKTVHLIFMNHLDVGYSLNNDPGYLIDVLNTYFNVYFPRAAEIASELKNLAYVERLVYTTHPWLLKMYLDCPPNLVLSGRKLKCPDPETAATVIAAIKDGDITWHAGPMNMEYEMMDQSMVEFAIQLSIDLDTRFGIERKHRTVSQRDVPGTTKAVIPILEKMGIEAISIGVNAATTPASVPPVFRWQSGNSSVLALYHPGGYPNGYGNAPWLPGGESRKDCAIVPGLDSALCFAFRSDNTGPPKSFSEVLTAYEIARSQFPNAKIKASKFEDFTAELQSVKSKLPVFTQEMGDVWIQGSGSDPRKTAEMRAMFRARALCFKEGRCSLSDPRVLNASVLMLKLGEHTWGQAGNCVDNIHWTNAQFDKMLKDPDPADHVSVVTLQAVHGVYPHGSFLLMCAASLSQQLLAHLSGKMYLNATDSWEEQRNFTLLALEALGNHSLADEIRWSLKAHRPQFPDFTGYHPVKVSRFGSSLMKCKGFTFKVNDQGALETLTDPYGRDWASSSSPMGRLVYQTYNQTDFQKFFDATTPYSREFFLGIGKPNMSENASPESKIWDTVGSVNFDPDKCSVVSRVSFKDESVHTDYGAPQYLTVNYTVTSDNQNPAVDVVVQWFGKRPTRLPEGLNIVFSPVERPLYRKYKWWLNKIDDLVDPLNVVVNGSQRLHAINNGVLYMDDNYKGLGIMSPDSAVVNLLTPDNYVSAIPLPLSPIKSITGVAFNLYNNVWETNYIFWYPYRKVDVNQLFRFRLIFS